jgi:hypothetical protein
MSCIDLAILSDAGSWSLSSTNLDTLVERYKGDYSCLVVDEGDTFLATDNGNVKVGGKHDNDKYNMGCRSISMQEGKGGLCTFEVAWAGFRRPAANGGKRPSGGFKRSSVTQPIQTHPNYKTGTNWGTVFGEGNSPNSFGRYEVEAGIFSHFGPLPEELAEEVRVHALKLRGVEAFLTGGQPVYSYTILTMKQWAPRDKLGQFFNTVSCKRIPCPEYDDYTWLLTAVVEDTISLWDDVVAWTTTLEFTRSAYGGWNPLLYKSGGKIDLDELSR